MNYKLGNDEYWQRDQESNVRLDVANEWDPDNFADSVPFDYRQEQERQPHE
jgi:hypothetical protein